MNFTGAPIRILVCALLAVYACSAKNVTIDAAFDFDPTNIYLFSGKEMLHVSDFGKHTMVMSRSSFPIPDDMNVQAAIRAKKGRNVIFYGDEYGLFVNFASGMAPRKLKYGKKRKFLQNGGPDAVNRIGDKTYVFKGCQMAIRYQWHTWGEPEDVRDYDLPCNIDAAWNALNTSYFLRGDQLWTWGSDNIVKGPMPLSETYSTGSWQLNPYEN